MERHPRPISRPRKNDRALQLHCTGRMGNLLWIIILILIVLWLGGFAMNIGGSLIHALLVIAIIIIIIRLITGRKVV